MLPLSHIEAGEEPRQPAALQLASTLLGLPTTLASLTRETPPPVITVQTAPVHVDVTVPSAPGAHRTVTHWTRNERGEITQTISERVPDEAVT